MKIKFANGVVKECAAPVEQKLFKNIEGETVGVGWLLILNILGEMTSAELDEILTNNDFSSIEFLSENENGEEKSLFTLKGYDKNTSSVIRHADDITKTRTEINLSKGV